VAIACCRAADDGPADELYPDPDSQLLAARLGDVGVRAGLLSWDDPAVDWASIPVVVIRSTWDSVDRPDEYVAWARRVDPVTTLCNPADVVAWDIDKRYLDDLARAGVGVVPTQWVRPGSSWSPPTGEYVVKPAVSAGGRETARYGSDHDDEARAHVARLLDGGSTVMVQPHLPAIADPGEISLVFVDGAYSHAVRKGPMLDLGGPVVPRPWERMVFLGLTAPTAAEQAAAASAVAAVAERFRGEALLYARVDLVDDGAGRPLVLEVELIDPNLSLVLHPPAAEALAAAVVRRLERAP
jgi:hypothetical protein